MISTGRYVFALVVLATCVATRMTVLAQSDRGSGRRSPAATPSAPATSSAPAPRSPRKWLEGTDEPMDETARAALRLFGAEITPFEGLVAGSARAPLIGLRVGRVDPNGPAGKAGIYSGDVLSGVFEPDPNMPRVGFVNGHTRSDAAFGRFLGRFGEGAQVLVRIALEKDPAIANTPAFVRVTHAIVTLGPSDPGALIERPRPARVLGLERDPAIARYNGWYEGFRQTPQGVAFASANLRPETPRGSLVGKAFNNSIENGDYDVGLYYDDRLCKSLSPKEVDVYLKSVLPPPADVGQIITPKVVRFVKGSMQTFCPSASNITLFLASGENVYAEYRIVPEGRRGGGLLAALVDAAIDYSWALQDPSIPAEKRLSGQLGFEPESYAYPQTIANIVDGRFELVRANPFIAGNLGNLFAHYAVAYGQSPCVKDSVDFKLTRTTTTTTTTLYGAFLSQWSNTVTDHVRLDKRHAKDFEAAFDARFAVLNPINTAMWEDVVELFANHPCSSPIHAAFEKNLLALRRSAN